MFAKRISTHGPYFIFYIGLNLFRVGTLYELDGRKTGPISHGTSSPATLLQVLMSSLLPNDSLANLYNETELFEHADKYFN